MSWTPNNAFNPLDPLGPFDPLDPLNPSARTPYPTFYQNQSPTNPHFSNFDASKGENIGKPTSGSGASPTASSSANTAKNRVSALGKKVGSKAGVAAKEVAKRIAPLAATLGSGVGAPLATVAGLGIAAHQAKDYMVDNWMSDPNYVNNLEKFNDLQSNVLVPAGVIQDNDGGYVDMQTGAPLSDMEVANRIQKQEAKIAENRDALAHSFYEEENATDPNAGYLQELQAREAAASMEPYYANKPLVPPTSTTKKARVATNTGNRGGGGNPPTPKTQEASGNWDWLMEILPLIAAGGVGYLAGRR